MHVCFRPWVGQPRAKSAGVTLCRTLLPAILTAILTALLAVPIAADVITPTTTTVYFERGGQAYHEPVSFTVACYGYAWPPGPSIERAPGTYTPVEVFSYSATCRSYGCEIDEAYYLNYRQIDYCDLSGETAGEPFHIDRYASSPVEFSTCDVSSGTRRCALRVDLQAGTVTSLSQSEAPGTSPRRSIERSFVLALLVTLIVELAVLWLLVRLTFPRPGINTGRLLFVGALASTLTLPYLWFVFPQFLDAAYAVYVGELLVMVIEAVILSRLLPTSLRRACVLSVGANVASFVAGVLLF